MAVFTVFIAFFSPKPSVAFAAAIAAGRAVAYVVVADVGAGTLDIATQ